MNLLFRVAPGGVSLRILSNICTRSLFSLTPNVIGRCRIFNCPMVSFSSRQPLFTNEIRLINKSSNKDSSIFQ
ncbi:hypothetical protein T06_15655 [Trichinella sp. T6]|nr:hypothetical protein T06_15655 [Trichinella sp. T6]KRX53352.1 hypothetical protein T09_2143 [Trichinella sp. T9]